MLKVSDQRRRFDAAAPHFDSADFVHSVTRDGLLSRLEPVVIEAKTVVDLGCATGSSARLLSKKFRGARVIAVDLSLDMLRQASGKRPWLGGYTLVQADATTLPFADQSIDLIFANQLLPWFDDPVPVFTEVSRTLREGGLFAFSTLGPDSLRSLRHEPFADMHDIGDAAVRAGLRDPVLDVDRLTVTYQSRDSLRDDLRATGGGHCFNDEIDDLDIELELIYGHCWGSGLARSAFEHRVDVAQIGRRDTSS